jgi:prepilin-type N-terminal cleavage/methylation domain-containing protein/prepilin-type processing-associated H-X9-DG protein
VPRQLAKAFTLIELLTVVAIISLLISILTPSLSRARAQAKATACAARLHEMGISTHIYVNDSGGVLPVAEYDPEGDCDKWGWAELLGQQNYRYKPPSEPNKPFPVQRNTDDCGRFMFYYFNCPALGKEADHTGHFRVYLPAWSYGSFQRDSQRKITVGADPKKSPVLDTISPQLPLLGDARRGVTGEASSYIAGGEAIAPDGTACFDDRHYGRTNLLYPDGHAELVPFDPNNPDNYFYKLNEDWDLDGVKDAP